MHERYIRLYKIEEAPIYKTSFVPLSSNSRQDVVVTFLSRTSASLRGEKFIKGIGADSSYFVPESSVPFCYYVSDGNILASVTITCSPFAKPIDG